MLPLVEVFKLSKWLPLLQLETFLEGAQRCRSNTEILSKQQGWAEGCSGTRGRAIASNCKCHECGLPWTVWAGAGTAEADPPSAQAGARGLPHDCRE